MSHLIDNIKEIFCNEDLQEDFLKKQEKLADEFIARVKSTIESAKTKTCKLLKRQESTSECLTELLKQRKNLKDLIKQQEMEIKILNKTNDLSENQIILDKEAIQQLKESTEQMTLELIDLERESAKRKEYLHTQWNALKKMCYLYKENLDFRIDTDMRCPERVTIEFFIHENPTDYKYFVVLVNQEQCWRVEKIEPAFTLEEKDKFKNMVDFKKHSEVRNVFLFLPSLRKHFKEKYFVN